MSDNRDYFLEQKLRDALAFDPLPECKWIIVTDHGIEVRVPYSERLSAALRAIGAGQWDRNDRCWRYPFSAADRLRTRIETITDLVEQAHENAEKETTAREEARKRATLEREAKRRADDLEATMYRPRSLRREYLVPNTTTLTTISIENIADDTSTALRQFGWRDSAFVAQVFGIHRDHPIRCHLPYRKDYSQANSKGSRGVHKIFDLEEGLIYEVHAPKSWNNTDVFFARVVNGALVRMTLCEVKKCLEK